MTKKFSVSVDFDANAAYIAMSDEDVAATREASQEILVDLDQFGVVAGIEFLRIDAEIPFQKLIDDFHVHSDDVDRLRALRPSIAGRFQSAADGESTVTRKGVFQTA